MTSDDLDTWLSGPPPAPAHEQRAHCQRCGGSFPGGFRACPYDATPLVVGRDPLIGVVIADRYRIESFAGEGGIGRVYLAKHVRLERRYAIKVPSGRMATLPHGRERFIREAQAASRLDHPNVVGVLDCGETDAGLLFIVMELAEGDTLTEVLRQRDSLPAAEALGLARQLAAGLDHAHDRGLVHRDLKPDNVMIERGDGRPRIIDFGLAIAGELDQDRLTSRGTVVGTPHYMAPEQVSGMPVDARTDLFALGIILYQALAGRLPFDGTPMDVVHGYLNQPIPRFATRVPGLEVDAEIEALCHSLTAYRPESRPASARDVMARIDRVLDRFAADRARGRVGEPPRESSREQTRELTRRPRPRSP